MKREFLQLCQTYNPDKYSVNGWFISAKLDGMRAFWDGGVSRGLLASQVPWANTFRDGRLVNEPVATGLWSRMAKVIYAPDWFLDQLPRLPLDGELYLGPGRFQDVMRIVKAHGGTDWEGVRYKIFDSPPLETVFADGTLDVRIAGEVYKRDLKGIEDWSKIRGIETVLPGTRFERVYDMLLSRGLDVIEQKRLPFSTLDIEGTIENRLQEALEAGDEGVVIRNHNVGWKPERGHHCLKYKPYLDSEGVVIGYTEGKGKLLGMMGAMIVEWKGKRFELSGFTEAERKNPMPVGSVVTFKYRELTNDGIPKEARYWRGHQ